VKAHKFVDSVGVHVRAGKGGDGCCSFRREACVDKGGPDGGDGGRGGHVILKGDHDEDSLQRLFFTPQLFAEDGIPGRGQKMFGRNGRDLCVKVPCGTVVYDRDTGARVADITEHGQEAVVARGGKGGLGNVHWKTATHQAPTEFTPGGPGEEFQLALELKLLADVGLVGFPNAGKSSLLGRISDAHPRVAAYPFTTLNPIVGTVCYPDFSQLRVADIPGLIEGAHRGVGLGHEFLRHLDRSRLLLCVIDMAGVDGREPWEDFKALRRELALHSAELARRPMLVAANKMDLPDAAGNLARFRRRVRLPIIRVSTADGTGIEEVKRRLWRELRPVPRGVRTAGVPPPAPAADEAAPDPSDGIVTEEKIRQAGFLDLPARKRGAGRA
jgi:GTP-binding protein